MDLLHNLSLGFGVALSVQNVLYAFFGAVLGTLIGVLPGLGPVATIAMLLPSIYSLDATPALIMLQVSGLMSLLPLLAKQLPEGGAGAFSALLGATGLGAVAMVVYMNAGSRLASHQVHKALPAATRKRRSGLFPSRERPSSAAVISGSNAAPASVSLSPGLRRSIKRLPKCVSSRRTRWLTALCVRHNSAAARVKLKCRATASKATSSRNGGRGRIAPFCAHDADSCAAAQSSFAERGARRDTAQPCAPTTRAPSSCAARSEERRVGKECRSRWSPYH